jgi:hypothetical protein
MSEHCRQFMSQCFRGSKVMIAASAGGNHGPWLPIKALMETASHMIVCGQCYASS